MSQTTVRSPARVSMHIALLAATYVAGAAIGLQLALENRNVTALWPPTGIAVAALVAGGIRLWPGVMVGAFAANLLNGASPATAAAITVGNTLAPVVAAFVLTRGCKLRMTLDRVIDVLALFAVGGAGAMLISAAGGTFALIATGATGTTSPLSIFGVWWVGDAIGVVLFAPPILLLTRAREAVPAVTQPIEWIGLIVATMATGFGVFSVELPVVFLVFIPAVWAALRFEQLGAASVTLALTVIALTRTVAGEGPFTFLSPTQNLIAIQTFNATIAFLSLMLAALMTRRKRAEALLRSSEERFRSLFEQASDVVCIHDRDGRLTYVNAMTEAITGFGRERLLTMNIAELIAPEDVRIMRRVTDRLIGGHTDAATHDVTIVSTTGRKVALEIKSTPVTDDGHAVAIQLIGRDVTSRKAAEDQLRHQALYDGLTSLPNRTLLLERLGYAITLAGQNRSRVALATVDIDNFASVNDEHGRKVADSVLTAIGSRLNDLYQPPSTVARMSGDEFAVVIPTYDPDKSPAVLGEQIKAEIEGPIRGDGTTASVAASIGIAVFPIHADDAPGLMQRAELAMFAAQRAGGGRYAVYQPEHDSIGARRIALLDELGVAIDEGGLLLHYQPRLAMDTMATVGVEALVRWQHPRLGLVQPVEFVPLAETGGMIGPLTAWVVEHGLEQCAAWKKAGHELTLSINLSTNALLDPSLVPTLVEMFDRTKIEPAQLVVEVPESTLMDEATHATLKRVAELGTAISIDDYGTGSSSIAHLQRLKISEIKIDRSFVIGMRSSKQDREIVRSIVGLAQSLDVRVVAEGVETRETWDQLAALGCNEAQGFLMCRPITAPELEKWLETPAWSARVR